MEIHVGDKSLACQQKLSDCYCLKKAVEGCTNNKMAVARYKIQTMKNDILVYLEFGLLFDKCAWICIFILKYLSFRTFPRVSRDRSLTHFVNSLHNWCSHNETDLSRYQYSYFIGQSTATLYLIHVSEIQKFLWKRIHYFYGVLKVINKCRWCTWHCNFLEILAMTTGWALIKWNKLK